MQQDHATTQDVVNNLINKAASGLDQITAMLSKHAPEAWALACKGVYAIGASEIAVGVLALVFGLLAVSISVWFFKKAAAVYKSEKSRSDDEAPFIIGGFGLGTPALILLIFAFCHLLDSDGWARVLSPDGYLAQQIITAATN